MDRYTFKKTHRNSFQAWAIAYCATFGLAARTLGNWIEIDRDGQPLAVMTHMGVQNACITLTAEAGA